MIQEFPFVLRHSKREYYSRVAGNTSTLEELKSMTSTQMRRRRGAERIREEGAV